eukprot:Gb_19454 [translate_table: standard]
MVVGKSSRASLEMWPFFSCKPGILYCRPGNLAMAIFHGVEI